MSVRAIFGHARCFHDLTPAQKRFGLRTVPYGCDIRDYVTIYAGIRECIVRTGGNDMRTHILMIILITACYRIRARVRGWV